MKSLGKGIKSNGRSCLYKLVILVIGAIIGSIIIPEAWKGVKEFIASKPYVAILISKNPIDFKIPEDFTWGFKKERGREIFFKTKDDKNVQIRHEEDFLSVEKTTLIAHRLISDNNCILVIGNSNSTLTNINLDIFLNSKNKIPFLMPIATDDNLLKKADAAEFKGLIMMLPNNSRQANAIERLVSKFAINRKVAIYGDEENPSYSINLSRDIAEKIRKKGGTIVIEELIGPTSSFYNSYIKWNSESKRPEVIVYVGVSHHGLLLLDQVSELDLNVPIIFTDGCLVKSLLANSQKLSGRAFILSPAEFKEEDLFLPSYEPIGHDAYKLASIIIKGSDGTRKGVLNYIENYKDKLDMDGDGGKYSFNSYGKNEERDYIIYEIKGGKLIKFIDY